MTKLTKPNLSVKYILDDSDYLYDLFTSGEIQGMYIVNESQGVIFCSILCFTFSSCRGERKKHKDNNVVEQKATL